MRGRVQGNADEESSLADWVAHSVGEDAYIPTPSPAAERHTLGGLPLSATLPPHEQVRHVRPLRGMMAGTPSHVAADGRWLSKVDALPALAHSTSLYSHPPRPAAAVSSHLRCGPRTSPYDSSLRPQRSLGVHGSALLAWLETRQRHRSEVDRLKVVPTPTQYEGILPVDDCPSDETDGERPAAATGAAAHLEGQQPEHAHAQPVPCTGQGSGGELNHDQRREQTRQQKPESSQVGRQREALSERVGSGLLDDQPPSSCLPSLSNTHPSSVPPASFSLHGRSPRLSDPPPLPMVSH